VVPSAANSQAYPPAHSCSAVNTQVPDRSDNGERGVRLSRRETVLFQHFVTSLSRWIDITDPDSSFGTVVPHNALSDVGLMRATLALSARHISLCLPSLSPEEHIELAAMDCVNLTVQYYHETLMYLQAAMQNSTSLRSDQLLATVLIISLFEMLDGFGRHWERHLKGVFWIQRSQLIHGESLGLKRYIWWAWLRQDIWAAFKNRRRILSFYKLTRPCSSLGFWELVNRSVFLLGQCVNYASDEDVSVGKEDLQARLNVGQELWRSLEEWAVCFSVYDRRLPTLAPQDASALEPIWIQPPAAGIHHQVSLHVFPSLLLLFLSVSIVFANLFFQANSLSPSIISSRHANPSLRTSPASLADSHDWRPTRVVESHKRHRTVRRCQLWHCDESYTTRGSAHLHQVFVCGEGTCYECSTDRLDKSAFGITSAIDWLACA
jgi:hypothetical protein